MSRVFNSILCQNCEPEHITTTPMNLYAIESGSEINRQIDDLIIKDHLASEKVIKLLLLGPSGSGKSTILKQMKIIHLNGYNTQELWARRSLIFKNVIDSVAQLLKGLQYLGIELPEERKIDAELIYEMLASNNFPQSLPHRIHKAIKRLWSETSVQEAFNRRSEFPLMDWAKFFIESIDRIAAPNYVPTAIDILYMRVETIGVNEISYTFSDQEIRIFDVGGEKTQRRKWIHLFDNVNALFYITAISEYDQVTQDDETTNRLQDALFLFKSIGNHEVFRDKQIILFFNKKDIFLEKIANKIPLTLCFPNYRYKNDYKNTTLYIQRKFEHQINDKDKTIYTHLTCATDTDHMNFVMGSVTDMIISKALKEAGI